ncbi:MAG: hypothetical protein HY719_11005 [Planctomycetes bacterium]|nr:hypothetical protein [Planctomycetota bacterium]
MPPRRAILLLAPPLGPRAGALAAAARRLGHRVEALAEGAAAGDGRSLATAAAAAQPDVVLAVGWRQLLSLAECPAPVVVDFAEPEMLWAAGAPGGDLLRAKIEALARADFFLFPSIELKRYGLPWLLLAGCDPTRLPAAVLPACGVDDDAGRPGADSAGAGRGAGGTLSLTVAGDVAPFEDPWPPLRAAAEEIAALRTGGVDVRLLLALHRRVADGPVVAREPLNPPNGFPGPSEGAINLHAAGGDADAGFGAGDLAGGAVVVDLAPRSALREIRFPAETVSRMRAGTPAICAAHAPLAGEIAGAGWLADPADAASVRAAVRAASADPVERLRRGAAARTLVRDRFGVEEAAIAPLGAFLESPARRPRGPAFLDLSTDLARLESLLDQVDYLVTNLEERA